MRSEAAPDGVTRLNQSLNVYYKKTVSIDYISLSIMGPSGPLIFVKTIFSCYIVALLGKPPHFSKIAAYRELGLLRFPKYLNVFIYIVFTI